MINISTPCFLLLNFLRSTIIFIFKIIKNYRELKYIYTFLEFFLEHNIVFTRTTADVLLFYILYNRKKYLKSINYWYLEYINIKRVDRGIQLF